MKLDFIDLTNLTPSPLNVRKHKAKDVSDLVTSISANGLLQPLLVRSNGESFEIVAGQRRYHACLAIAAEQEYDFDPIPCLIMDDGDDAAAIEASLAENIARLPMDEIDQYRAFAALIKEGRTADEIAAHFGVTERLVTQRLAIANLYSPILTAYRKDDVRGETLRLLTMATKAQQKAWWALYKSEDEYAPQGRALKAWLFGGGSIPVANALFDVEASGLPVVKDLFGEDDYFADVPRFWEAQSAALSERIETYKVKGWCLVHVHEVGAHWPSWEYTELSKAKGGEVHITCADNGEISFHEGYVETKAYRKAQAAKERGESAPQKPEITKAMQNYLALHRHAAVRRDLLNNPQLAQRLMLAHVIAGSSLWQIEAEPQKADKEVIADSLAANPAQIAFEAERQAVAKLLCFEDDSTIVDDANPFSGGRDLATVFATLINLSDEDVQRIQTFMMAETLASGTGLIEVLGQMMGTDVSASWQADETFFDLLRDKQVINAMVAEIAGDHVAASHVTSTAKVQKKIITDCLRGNRTAVTSDWQPRYMHMPMQAYTERGGIAVMDDAAGLAGLFEVQVEPDTPQIAKAA